MNNEIISNQIRELLETINEQIEALREYREKIPQIEFDLVLQNIRKLYEEMHVLQRMNDPYDYSARTLPAGHKTVPEPVTRTVENPKPSPHKEPPQEKEKKVEKSAGMDLFAAEDPAFTIRLQEAREQSLPLRHSPSDHLKALISINDKFIFINELFDGNLREYNETIETLNGFQDRRQAFDFFDLVRSKNLWDPASTAFTKLQEVLERKFG
jgi:hypothetical protein